MPPTGSDADVHENVIPLLRRYMPELDTARGIAVLLVLAFHGLQRPQGAALSQAGSFLFSFAQFGWTGVNLFFVLSGFLITGILLDSRTHRDYFSSFYKRRVLRILPPLYATLLLLQLGSWVPWRFTVLSAFFLANCAPLFAVPLRYTPLWSLAVEEHFYLLWPALVRRLSPRTLTAVLLGICLSTPFLRLLELPHRPGVNAFFTWFNLDGLALGALLAIWMRSQIFRREHMVAFSAAAGLAGIIGFALLLQHSLWQIALQVSMCNLASVGLISAMLLLGTSPWRPLVDRPFLRFCGYISYGLYLIHMLIFKCSEILFSPLAHLLQSQLGATLVVLLRFLFGSTLAIVVAYLSRRSLEEFFLRLRKSTQLIAVGENAVVSPELS